MAGDGGHLQPGDPHGQEASPLTVLVDECRRIRDGRDCEAHGRLSRAVRQAEAHLVSFRTGREAFECDAEARAGAAPDGHQANVRALVQIMFRPR